MNSVRACIEGSFLYKESSGGTHYWGGGVLPCCVSISWRSCFLSCESLLCQRRRAMKCAWLMSGFVGALLLAGIAAGFGLRPSSAIVGWIFTLGSGFLTVFTLGNLAFGTTIRKLHQRMNDRCLTRFIKREAEATGLDLGAFE